MKGTGCRYHHGSQKIKNYDHLAEHGVDSVLDIEDLVKFGKRVHACPYYTSRTLLTTAELVICPYNYLIDPLIRQSMDIVLTNQIIVLDEAHNIEDSAREAASCTVPQGDMLEASLDLQSLAKKEINPSECTVLFQMLDALCGWVNQNSDKLTDYTDYDRSGKIFKGTEMIAHLELLGIGCSNFKKFKNADGWFGKGESCVGWKYSINFWCLNPAVTFSAFGGIVRSIILTSGTLSPMSTFQSELGIPFKIQLEANHVIDKSQVWVGTIGKGPTEHSLQATYRHTESFTFQDELGKLILDVCKTVPRGILCFLPSYAMLNKLVNRLETSGVTGAAFLAVCRGKVSEGLDFTDDNARAVIAVGIPYPNVKNIQVDLKRQYNNQHCQTRGLLTGDAWAINQALGRCIRHRYDWGALILVDERYQRGSLESGLQENKYTRGLSKWVRNKIVHSPSFSVAISNLQHFTENMIAHPPVNPERLDETVAFAMDVEMVKPAETSSCVSVDCSNSKMQNKMNESSDVLFRGLKSSPLHSNSKLPNLALDNISTEVNRKSNMRVDPQGNNESCLYTGISASIVSKPHGNFIDLNKEGDILIPSGKLPFTSTQITSSREVVPPQMVSNTSHKKYLKTKSNYFFNALTLTDNNLALKSNCVEKIAEVQPTNLDPPCKKRKSYSAKAKKSKTGENDEKNLKKVETSRSSNDSTYIFEYIDENVKSNVSPLKVLLENEMKEKIPLKHTIHSNKTMEKIQSSGTKISGARKSLAFETIDQCEGEVSINHEEPSSLPMFDLYENQHSGDSPFNPSQNIHSTETRQKELSMVKGNCDETIEKTSSCSTGGDVRTTGNLPHKLESPGSKRVKELCNTKKRPKSNRRISSFDSIISEDDSDLDDFNMSTEMIIGESHHPLSHGYQAIYSDPIGDGGHHGGSAILVSTSKNIPFTTMQLHCPLQAVAVHLHLRRVYAVCSLYLPPGTPVSRTDLINLIGKLPPPFSFSSIGDHQTLRDKQSTSMLKGVQYIEYDSD
ncbi:Fanconi anemia group J protein-like [Homarus americanus]|uniref:Fanconi anemia group J protein-like n=1 Tax=Homarus americanus TaxID=6706 RepID=A0A8J5JGE8_HOMAM|nr:Fanconi anemia group J protein-like [Homarus americanus]